VLRIEPCFGLTVEPPSPAGEFRLLIAYPSLRKKLAGESVVIGHSVYRSNQQRLCWAKVRMRPESQRISKVVFAFSSESIDTMPSCWADGPPRTC
jgi:hypothetical protein